MAGVGTTAVLALVPEGDALLEVAAGVDPRAVRPGVPAHAALLYPWLPAAEVDEAELARLRGALEGAEPVALRLAAVERSGDFLGVPLPELDPPAAAVRAAYPRQAPYGGRFGARPPVHLTVALGATPEAAAEIERRAGERLPLAARVTELYVVELAARGWRPMAVIPLTGGRAGA